MGNVSKLIIIKLILSINLIIINPSYIFGQSDEDAKAIITIALAMKNRNKNDIIKTNEEIYKEAYDLATVEKKRLAVFIGIPARKIDNVVTVSVKWEGLFKKEFPNNSIAVAGFLITEPRWLSYLGNLPANIPDKEIITGGKKTLDNNDNNGKAVQPLAADPFRFFQSTIKNSTITNCRT